MDASDLDGDGQTDHPAPVSSSLYGWSFTPDNGWSDGNWFAFRGNQQNGRGVADFATIWYQCIQEGFGAYQTVVMAYEENGLSWQGSAPFYGLDSQIPYSALPGQQLYADNVPAATLNGLTVYNGALVDPGVTPHTLEFSTLAQTFTEPAGWTHCTDTHWEGKIGEILFYEQELDEAQLTGVSEYLRRKWISTADLESVRAEVRWENGIVGNTEALPIVELTVAPNPANQHATLLIRDATDQAITITLYNMLGQPLYQENLPAEQATFRLDHWLYHLSGGMYILRASTAAGQQTSLTLVKQ
jgi:hypothetical protein